MLLFSVLTFLCYCSHLSCYCSHLFLLLFSPFLLLFSPFFVWRSDSWDQWAWQQVSWTHTQFNVILNYNFFFSSTFLNSFCSQGPVLRPGFYTLCTIFGRCRDSTPSCYNCSRYATHELHTSLDNIINLNINFLSMEIIVLNFP